MDGPYRLTTRKTAKDRIKGHWYYYYFKDGKRIREMNKLKELEWTDHIAILPKICSTLVLVNSRRSHFRHKNSSDVIVELL